MEHTMQLNYFDILSIAQKSYAKLLTPLCREYELTRNELDVLLFLHNNPEFDRASDIVNHRGMAKSHVSLSVASLEERQLLLRTLDDKDRRIAHLVLTEEGQRIAAQARQLQNTFFAGLYRGVSREEFALWGQVTKKVCENIRNLDKTLTID